MSSVVMETRGHTTSDGRLHLNIGVADADVTVVVRLTPQTSSPVDANGWPIGYFESVVGSMPDLERGMQGEFEQRLELE